MPTYISLLRGINVGGHRKIRMADLRTAYESLDMANVASYVQSGNVVFDCKIRSASKVAESIERLIEDQFGHDVAVLVRTPNDFGRLIEGNPFSVQAKKDPTKVSLMFLAARPSASLLSGLDDVETRDDEFIVGTTHIYLHYPNGCARTKLNNTFFERRLKMPTTTRNWKTVEALYEIGMGSTRS